MHPITFLGTPAKVLLTNHTAAAPASKCGRKVIEVTLSVANLLIYQDFHTQPSSELTKNCEKKRKYPASVSHNQDEDTKT